MKYTSRMGLTIPDESDDLTACRENWAKLDHGFSGAIWVNPGVVPDASLLFNGAIVAEIGTGKVWRAFRTSSGAYRQEWIKFPWLWSGGREGTYITTGSWNRLPMTADKVITAQCVNSGAGDLSADGSVVLPLDAVYLINVMGAFPTQSGNTTGVRGIGYALNNNANPATPLNEAQYVRLPYPTAGASQGRTDHVIRMTKYLAKGTRIVPVGYNGGVSVTPEHVLSYVFVAVLRPVTK